jgi:hypothetical protein
MSTIYLNYLTCERTNDQFGGDEVYLTRSGVGKIWGTEEMNTDDSRSISQELLGSEGAVQLTLFDEEDIGDDDFLGNVTISGSESRGEHSTIFRNNAHYTLYYIVH